MRKKEKYDQLVKRFRSSLNEAKSRVISNKNNYAKYIGWRKKFVL